MSATINSLSHDFIRNITITYTGELTIPFLSHYMDWVAMLLVLFISCLVAIGAKISANFNSLLTAIAICGITFVSIAGFILADLDNWTNKDNGGFLPFGIKVPDAIFDLD